MRENEAIGGWRLCRCGFGWSWDESTPRPIDGLDGLRTSRMPGMRQPACEHEGFA
jgi:hypothetical protein